MERSSGVVKLSKPPSMACMQSQMTFVINTSTNLFQNRLSESEGKPNTFKNLLKELFVLIIVNFIARINKLVGILRCVFNYFVN